MSVLIVLLLTAAAVAYVGYPLLARRGDQQPMLLIVEPEAMVIAGVAYASEEEWVIDRALDKADDGVPEATAGPSLEEIDVEIERRVADLRRQRSEQPSASKRAVCQECGKPFQGGDRFCGRCGAPHPNVCPQCGERHLPGDLFCARCGAALSGGQE
ncbi:MAG TPA: zinc ribbon domain-containing protein [Anaerolineae bacterium]|nr:zinc ribbon domain-containing protein [Anaerolineae bacterium]HPL28828.1 zinc ribbon domain-containing protein [Anaerolineae bacterium]